MGKHCAAVFAVLGFALAAANGQTNGTAEATTVPAYTLEDCIAIGLERSIPLANARRDQAIAEEDIRAARSEALPSIDVDASYTRLDEVPSISFGDFEQDFGREDNYSAGATLGQLLYSGGGVRAAIRAAKHYRAFTANESDRQTRALVRDITKSFNNVLYERAAVDVSSNSVQQLVDFYEETKLKYEHEAASEFDTLSAEVKVANERPRLLAARNRLDLAKTAFRNLIYLDEEVYRLDGELTYTPVDVELDALYAIGLANRPELRKAQLAIRMREEDIRVSRSDYLPEIRAFATYEGVNPDQAEPAEDAWDWGWTAGLSASWSILDGGLRKAELRAKQLRRIKAEADLEDMRRTVKLEIQNAYLTLDRAREVVESTEDTVALAEKALEIARVRYDKGLATYLEFTDSNLSLSRARLTHHEALRSYLNALADLHYACAADDLEQQPENQP
jgi:outer membrane protein TolC